MPKVGKVYLLGAGPGDPELITARALRRLRTADVVLYDALVHPDQLAECKADAELVFVGKRAGRKGERQTKINERMVNEARAGRTVVRLKGGDPYLFGRGSEEAEHLAEHGVPFEVVPGVPSPLAATAYAGLSLTHRDLASSVTYITATESADKDRTSHDWAKLATATQTLVIFMGMRKLDTLMDLLVTHGRPPTTPAAVVQWGSLPRQRTVIGTIADIHQRVLDAELTRPAITIVGDVVDLRRSLRWFDAQPLFGKRVLVARPTGQAAALCQLLRDHGAEPVRHAAIAIAPPQDRGPLLGALERAGEYDWLLFTSQNAVSSVFSALAGRSLDARALAGPRVVAVGKKTATALNSFGVSADFIAGDARAEGVVDTVLNNGGAAGQTVLLPRAEVAREVLPRALTDAGLTVDVIVAYRTVETTPTERQALRNTLESETIDAVLFTSGSTVDQLCGLLGARAKPLFDNVTLAAIGPVTADALSAHGLSADVVAQEATMQSLVQDLAAYYADNQA